MFITIFTPTYNRCHHLSVLYNSLLTQSYKDFEWVVVDDGSIDDTQEQIEEWIKENKIRINFAKQKNAGKHIAINTGATLAKGDLFFTVDSDDHLTENALERIYFHWQNVVNLPEDKKKNIVGLAANRVYPNGQIIGGEVNYNILDCTLLELRFIRNIKGDKAEIYKTSVVRDNPFPKFEGERFCPESLIFYRLADQGYKLRFFNENIYVCEYLEGGLTKSSFSTLKNGPFGTLHGYADVTRFKEVPLKVKIKYAVLFWRFSFYAKKQSVFKKMQLLPNILYCGFYPAGLLLHIKDRINASR